MNSHSKHSAQATISLFSMKGKSWSCYQKHVANFIDFEHDGTSAMPPSLNNADVQRLDMKDYNLYGISPGDPGPMVLCNQCSHIMAPEGVMRHVKRVHGSKIVPAPSNKVRIALAAKGISTAGALLSSNAGISQSSISNSAMTVAASASYTISTNLSNEFSNRLNVTHSLDSMDNNGLIMHPTTLPDDLLRGQSSNSSSNINNSTTIRPNQISVTTAIANSSSSNSNSPISSTKTSTSSSSGKGRSRKQTSKDREYDPEKHCGVRIGNMKPCTRSLTCKTHAVSLRRNVDGRSKPFDQLLADHRNNAKDTYHKHGSSKQTNYSIGDNSNQMLDSIGDSNSSSSFDIERRSFSSNSNQSTIGNYNSDHSTAFSTNSQQITGINGSLSTLPDTNHRKTNYTILSPDERSTNISQFSDLSMNSNMVSILQSGSNSSMTGPVGLNSFNEYSVNDLINDDNGDAFDMTFWENFENINYEADVMMSGFNASTKKHDHKIPSTAISATTIGKTSTKRTTSSIDDSERKRKRGNESKDTQTPPPPPPPLSSNRAAADKELSDEMQKFSDSLFGSDLIKTNKKIVVSGHSLIKKPTPKTIKPTDTTNNDIICIDDDEDDLVIVSESKSPAIIKDKRSISPPIIKIGPTKSLKPNIDLIITQNGKSASKSIADKLKQKLFTDYSSKDKENGLTHTITKLPEISLKETAASIEQSIIKMTLSKDQSVHTADLRNITKILSEEDHRNLRKSLSKAADDTKKSTESIKHNKHSDSKHPKTVVDDAKQNDVKSKIEPVIKLDSEPATKPDPIKVQQQTRNLLGSVPMDENENFLLDMMYKCLRGKRVRLTDSNHLNNNNNNNYTSVSRMNGTDAVKNREKENTIEMGYSDDENVIDKQPNSLLLPMAQRCLTLKRNTAKPIGTNQFAMARGYGICHVKNAVSSTRAVQQNFFERMQAQQPNGSFSSTMMAVRNGSLIRLNNTGAINTAVNVTPKPNSPGTQAQNQTNTVNACQSPTANSSIVIVNSGTTPNSTLGGQSYTIFRRPSVQNIQLITRKTIDQTYAVMPVIHCVRTRTMKPNVAKTLQTDQLIASLKTIIRPQKLSHQTMSTTKKVISVYKTAMQTQQTNLTNSSRSQKIYHTQPTSILMTSPQKQNGHHSHSTSNGSISPRSSHKNSSQKKS